MAKLLDIENVVKQIEDPNAVVDECKECDSGSLDRDSEDIDNSEDYSENFEDDLSDDFSENEIPTAHRLEKIPRDVNVKKRFEDHYRELLGENYDKFMNYSLSYIRKCIRVNTLKTDVEEVKARLSERWQLEEIPWCKEGFWITFKDGKRFDIGNLIEHHLGYIYVQEAASMIPPVVLAPEPNELVLDMCAAPGSKTTQIAAYMKNTGLLVANDISGSRLKALGMNLQRCGVTNSVITLTQDTRFRKVMKSHPDFTFDRILVDAPCSGTGTIRKSLRTINMWNPLGITKLNKIQKTLIETAFDMLKVGGTMVYSTCTIEPEENEAVVSYLLEKYPNAKLDYIDAEKLGMKRTPSITSFQGLYIRPEVTNCLRIMPYDNDSEGFFVARIRKE